MRTPDDGSFSNQRHLLDRIIHLRDKPVQREVIITRTVKRQRQDRHVINRPRLDERHGNAVRDAVEVLLHFLVQLHQAAFHVFADLEPHDRQRLAFAGSGVDVFHAGNFPEQLFHRARGAFLDFFRMKSRHGHQHIHHRHFDLRLFLTRQHHHGKHAEQEGCDDDEQGQLGINE